MWYCEGEALGFHLRIFNVFTCGIIVKGRLWASFKVCCYFPTFHPALQLLTGLLNVCFSLVGNRALKRAWSKEEAAAVRRHLNKFINLAKVPGKSPCQQCINAEQEVLGHRDRRAVKFYVKNLITAQNSLKNWILFLFSSILAQTPCLCFCSASTSVSVKFASVLKCFIHCVSNYYANDIFTDFPK